MPQIVKFTGAIEVADGDRAELRADLIVAALKVGQAGMLSVPTGTITMEFDCEIDPDTITVGWRY